MIGRISKTIKSLIRDYKERRLFNIYNAQWLRYMKEHGFENKPVEGEEEYLSYWSRVSKYVSPLDYRYFSHFKPEWGG